MLLPFGLSVAVVFAQAQISSQNLTPEQWRQDLAYLASEWPKRHKNLYHYVSEADWKAAVARLERRIPQLQRHEIIVELGRLSAMIKDSHTGIGTFRQAAIDFHRLPIEVKYFSDGVFITKAAPDHLDLLGAKIIKIGSGTAEVALDSVAKVISADPGNMMRTRDVGPIMLGMPEVMHAFHFISSLDRIPLTIEKDGKPTVVTVKPVTRTDYDAIQWKDWEVVKPIALGTSNRKFWYRYLPAERMMYVQINEMDNDSTAYLAETFKNAVAATDSLPVDRFVIDLRYNSGGSSSAVKPMVLSLIKSRFDQHGKLFVLIGRVTASAAQNFVNDLESLTNVVFIGEPTAQNPSFYSDGYVVTLPNSKIQAFNATIWSQTVDARNIRPYSAPNVVAEWSSTDYRDSRDPGLDAARHYSGTRPLPLRILGVALEAGPKVAGDSLKAEGQGAVALYRNLSREMIRYSFDQLWTNGRSDDAILLLESNTVAHPDDWNSHDALAGAYENKSRLSEALREYQRALALNPDHQGVKDGIKRVEARLRTAH